MLKNPAGAKWPVHKWQGSGVMRDKSGMMRVWKDNPDGTGHYEIRKPLNEPLAIETTDAAGNKVRKTFGKGMDLGALPLFQEETPGAAAAKKAGQGRYRSRADVAAAYRAGQITRQQAEVEIQNLEG